jgi:hypothetical protein
LAFDRQVRLFAITGSNELIRIDTTTGVGTLIGIPSVSGITALGMRTDSLILAVDDSPVEQIPDAFELAQNFPNPFNPATEIRYSLPERSHVRLAVFNALGQTVTELVNGEYDAGYHVVRWDGTNSSGGITATGIYFYRLEAVAHSGESFTSIRKMMVVK